MSKRGPKGSHLQLVDATEAGGDTKLPESNVPPRCGGRTKRGGECKVLAGQGTEHAGAGQCWHHDGQVEPGSPCPLPLTKIERRLWDEISDQLQALRLLKAAFWPHIFGLVVALAALHTARQAAMVGQAVRGDNGTWKKHPSSTVVNQMLAQIRNYANDLGLNPSALAGMDVEPDPGRKPSTMEGLIRGRT